MKILQLPTIPFPWQSEVNRLHSGDRIWILTDVEGFSSSMHAWSPEQQWYRVGGLDLKAMRLGYFTFSIDDVRAMVKAGMSPAPWLGPLPHGVEVVRVYHGPTEKGRFREKVTLLPLPPELEAQGPALRRYFARTLRFHGNSEVGMWKRIQDWANRENSIEGACFGAS